MDYSGYIHGGYQSILTDRNRPVSLPPKSELARAQIAHDKVTVAMTKVYDCLLAIVAINGWKTLGYTSF